MRSEQNFLLVFIVMYISGLICNIIYVCVMYSIMVNIRNYFIIVVCVVSFFYTLLIYFFHFRKIYNLIQQVEVN